MSDFLQPHASEHTWLLYSPLSLWVCLNSCPLSQWYYLTISPSAAPFFSCPQSFPAAGSFPMSWLFTSGGQSIRASALVLPMNIHSWFPLGLTGLISLLSKGHSEFLETSYTWILWGSCLKYSLLEPKSAILSQEFRGGTQESEL